MGYGLRPSPSARAPQDDVLFCRICKSDQRAAVLSPTPEIVSSLLLTNNFFPLPSRERRFFPCHSEEVYDRRILLDFMGILRLRLRMTCCFLEPFGWRLRMTVVDKMGRCLNVLTSFIPKQSLQSFNRSTFQPSSLFTPHFPVRPLTLTLAHKGRGDLFT